MNYIKGLSISLLILISLTDLLCLQAGEFETLAETEEVPEAYVPRAVIKLRTGDRIVGELKPEEIRFQSNRFGIVNIKVNNMFSFAEDKLSLKDGNVISGKFIDNLIVTTESGNTFSGIKWIDIEELSMKSPEEGVDGKEALLETAENKPPPYTPPNYTKIFKDQYKDRGSSYYGPTMNYGPQGLSNMIDSKVPILRPGEFGKKYVDDVMPSLPKDMMKPLPPEEKDRKNPFVYDDYYDPMSGGTYSDNSNSLTSSMDILSSGSAFNDKIETDTTPIETPADVTGTKDLKELPIVTDLTGFLDQKKGSHLAI